MTFPIQPRPIIGQKPRRKGRPGRDDDDYRPYGKYAELMDLWIGARLQARRHRLGLSREVVAQAINVSKNQIVAWELGTTKVSVGRLFELALALEIPPGWFFEGADASDLQMPPELALGAEQMAVLRDPRTLTAAADIASLEPWQRKIVDYVLMSFKAQNGGQPSDNS